MGNYADGFSVYFESGKWHFDYAARLIRDLQQNQDGNFPIVGDLPKEEIINLVLEKVGNSKGRKNNATQSE